jgi:3-isopropylmalate dehydrogenase
MNPLAAISAAQMMCAHLREESAAEPIERAVMKVTAEKIESLSAGKMGYSTSEIGDLVAGFVA